MNLKNQNTLNSRSSNSDTIFNYPNISSGFSKFKMAAWRAVRAFRVALINLAGTTTCKTLFPGINMKNNSLKVQLVLAAVPNK